MPTLKVVTWNCDPGESNLKWQQLKFVLDWHDNNTGHPVDVVAIQEANANAGGTIYNGLLNTGALGYPSGVGFHAPQHIRETATGGRGYIVAARSTINNLGNVGWYNYNADASLTYVQGHLTHTQLGYWNTAKALRRPVTITFDHGGDHVRFATWHAPRGLGMLFGAADTYQGGAHPDAVAVVDHSRLVRPNHIAEAVVVFAGDFNMTNQDFNRSANGITTPRLAAAERVGNHLDHILAIQGTAGGAPVIQNGLNSNSVSAHDFVSAEVVW